MSYRPLQEGRVPPPESQTVVNKPLVVLLPGLSTTYRNSQALSDELSRYGDIDGRVWNSIISTDRPDPQRFLKMAEAIGSALNKNRKVLVIGWSLGGLEAIQALLTLSQKDRQFDQHNLSRLELVLVSPAGLFEGISGFTRFFSDDLPKLIRSVHKESAYKLLDTLVTFPPANVGSVILGETLRRIFPELSLLSTKGAEGVHRTQQISDRNYFSLLEGGDRQKIDDLDRQLAEALLEQPSEKQQLLHVHELMRKRGKILQPYEEKLTTIDYIPSPGQRFRPDLFAVSLLGFLPAVRRMVLGNYPDTLRKLISQGATVRFLVPEYDAFIPLERILEIFPENSITIIERSTHTIVLPPQPTTTLAEALRNLNTSKT